MNALLFILSTLCFVLVLLGASLGGIDLMVLGLALLAAGHIPFGPIVIFQKKDA